MNSQGKRLRNPRDIANTFSGFYAKLYKLAETDPASFPTQEDIVNPFLSAIHLRSISLTQRKSLSAPFCPKEILKVIKKLPLHKAPVHDRIPNKYKKFSTVLPPSLQHM